MSLHQLIPETEPLSVLAAGATRSGISAFPAAIIPGIEESYVRAVRYALALCIPLAGLAFLVSFLMPSFKYHITETKEMTNKVDSCTVDPKIGLVTTDRSVKRESEAIV